MGNLLIKDMERQKNGKLPRFQKYFRLAQDAKTPWMRIFYKIIFKHYKEKNCVEFSVANKIGEGLYIGHPYSITINVNAIIGKNCNIHKGVTIGQENRGIRKGSPIIGDCVWIGVNATIVGKIAIGDNVLIAPNSYVNCDVPSNSIVLGNPCKIKHCKNATEGYINRMV